MKTLSLGLLLVAMTVNAQPIGDDAIVTRLNLDLMALRSLSVGSPERSQAMGRYASDINKLYPIGFVTRDLAYALTSALAGKGLSDDTLTPLTRATLGIIDSAFACRTDSSDLRNSVQFRASIEQAYHALLALDASAPNTRVVMGLLFRAADRIAHPIVRPIPPAHRVNR
jgi:hypothetical protein